MRAGGARPRHRVGRTSGPDPQVRAEPSMLAAPGLRLRPCLLENAARGLPGRAPLHASQPMTPRATRAIPAHSFDQLWGVVRGGRAGGPGQARLETPEAGPGREGGRGVPEAAWRRRPRSTDLPGQLGSKKGPFPACRLSSASPPKLTSLSPSFSKGPPGWAFVSSQGPERGIHWLKGKQHITTHSPPRLNSSPLWSRKWDPQRPT